MGGEKNVQAKLPVKGLGSPPRGRGKDLREAIQMIKMGITPAWAGKSSAYRHPLSVLQDHPRVGGEKDLQAMCQRL